MSNYYIIKEIKPKHGPMRDIHEDIVGQRCYIVHLEIGERAMIKCEVSYDPGTFHTVLTSTVENWMSDNPGSWVTIETRNTLYILEELEDGAKQGGASDDLPG